MRAILLITALMAHQPVMDMAPRWSGGYGFQIRNEFIPNVSSTNWFEGVYTRSREKRITFKIPLEDGKTLGSPIIALPLKKYQNHSGYTENWGITPQVKIPIEGKGGTGLSISYSSEDPRFYQMYDFFGWRSSIGEPSYGFDGNIGLHPIHRNKTNSGIFTMWDVTFRKSKRITSVHSGPVLVIYRKNIMARIEFKLPLKGNNSVLPILNSGIGFVF